MKKIFFIGLMIFLWGCENNYTQFHEAKNAQIISHKEHEIQLKNFDFGDIQTLSGVQMQVTPDTQWLDDFVEKIEKSQKRVWVEVYIFTEKRLQKALVDAKERGVDVKIVLEKNVYKAPQLNQAAYKNFQKNNIPIVWSDAKDYSLNHSKMTLVDDEAIISTGNYSYSTFSKNREFFVIAKDQEMIKVLEDIFIKDFAQERYVTYHPNLVLSPFSSREKMSYLIRNAQKKVQIYALNFSDTQILELLIKKQKSGVKVEVILPDLKKVASNEDEIAKLKQAGISVSLLKKPELHAKAILCDEQYLYVGSVNFSSPSMDQNREIGFLLKNEEIISRFMEVFSKDF